MAHASKRITGFWTNFNSSASFVQQRYMRKGSLLSLRHDDVIKWKHFPRYWPFVSGEFPSQRPMTRSFDVFFDLRPSKRLNKQLRRHRAHYDVAVMNCWNIVFHCTNLKYSNKVIILTCMFMSRTNLAIQFLNNIATTSKRSDINIQLDKTLCCQNF